MGGAQVGGARVGGVAGWVGWQGDLEVCGRCGAGAGKYEGKA